MKVIRLAASTLALLFVATFLIAARPAPPNCNEGNPYSVQTGKTIYFCSPVDCLKFTKLKKVMAYTCTTWCCPDTYRTGINYSECEFDRYLLTCCSQPPGEFWDDPINQVTCADPPSGGGG